MPLRSPGGTSRNSQTAAGGKQANEELTGQITDPQLEEAPLRREYPDLESETRQQKPKLRVLPESHEDQFTQLQKKTEEETSCLEMEKKLPSTSVDI